jgi:hypothetical protein
VCSPTHKGHATKEANALYWPSRKKIILEAIGTIVYISDLQTDALIKVFDPCIHLATVNWNWTAKAPMSSERHITKYYSLIGHLILVNLFKEIGDLYDLFLKC